MLPASDLLQIKTLEGIFKNKATSYKYVLLLSLLDTIKARGFGGWDRIPLRRLAVEMLTLLYVPYDSGLVLATRSKESSGPALQKMEVPRGLTSRNRVRDHVALRYNASQHGDILEYVPYRLIRPFFPDLELPPDQRNKDSLVNARIIELAAHYFDSIRPIYRIQTNKEFIDVHPDWGSYLTEHYDIIRNWVAEQWRLYIASLNSNVQDLDSRLFWEEETPSSLAKPGPASQVKEPEQAYAVAVVEPVAKTIHNESRTERASTVVVAPLAIPSFFNGIEQVSAEDRLMAATNRLVDALESLPKPCSLCEIAIEDGDVNWLQTLLSSLPTGLLANWLTFARFERPQKLRGVTRRQSLGLMMFLFFAELTRRQGREGEVWAPIRASFSERASHFLFNQSQPNSCLLEALVDAANKFGLRNVFGVEGVQQYYLSIFLQFGFTSEGIVNLPYWLTGSSSQAIMRLTTHGAVAGSTSFRRLWQDLLDFRTGRISTQVISARIEESPWILPKDAARVIEHAARSVAAETVPESFVFDATLVWNGKDEPHFLCNVNINGLELPNDVYSVVYKDFVVCKLVRSADGQFPPGCFKVECDASTAVFQLKSAADEIIESCCVDFWADDEDVQCFDMSTGRRLEDAYAPLDKERRYVVLANSDLNSSIHVDWCKIAGGERTLFSLPPSRLADFELTLDGGFIWDADLTGSRRTLFDTVSVSVYAESAITGNDSVHFQISGMPAGASIKSARIGALRLTFINIAKDWLSVQAVTVSDVLKLNGMRLSLTIETNERVLVISRPVNVSISGMIYWSDKSWSHYPAERPLSTKVAKQNPFKIFLPTVLDNNPDVALFEGERFVRRLSSKKDCIRDLAGYGAPLLVAPTVIQGVSKNVSTLSSSVIDTGILEYFEREDDLVRLKLRNDLEPTSSHEVFLWDYCSEPVVIDHNRIGLPANNEWEIHLASHCLRHFSAVAIAYDGYRIGSVCHDTEKAVKKAAQSLGAQLAASLLRWWHFPLLQRSLSSQLQELIKRSPGEVLSAWLDEQGVWGDCVLNDDLEHWCATVREVLKNWKPDSSEEAVALLATLKGRDNDFYATLAKLFQGSPECAARIIKSARGTPVFPKLRESLEALVCDLLCIPARSSSAQIRSSTDSFLADCALILDADRNFLKLQTEQFVEALLSSMQVTDANRHNVSAFIRAPRYRNYLSALIGIEILNTRRFT